jgi:hypothetical protein
MHYPNIEDNGAHQGVYFILDQSQSEPPLKRVRIMMQCSGLLDSNNPVRAQLYDLANELQDVEQETACLIGRVLRSDAKRISENEALQFYFERLETAPVELKIVLLSNASNMGFSLGCGDEYHTAWVHAFESVNQFTRRFEAVLFDIRTRRFERSNADALTTTSTTTVAAAATTPRPATRRSPAAVSYQSRSRSIAAATRATSAAPATARAAAATSWSTRPR